jgi:hypothetical protein
MSHYFNGVQLSYVHVSRGAQIHVPMSRVTKFSMIVGCMCGTWVMSPFWHLEF